VRLAGVVGLDDGYQIARMLHLAKAAGVLFGMTWSTAADAGTFTMAPTADTPVAGSTMGFDAGVWAVVADGSWLPPAAPPVPPTPDGQLTIGGAPLVIGGAPLVLTGA